MVAAVMARYRLESKRADADSALRQLISEPLTVDETLAMRRSG